MSTTVHRLGDGETITLEVVSGKWYEAWTRPYEGEPMPKEIGYKSTPEMKCPSHRDMGVETWEGPGTIVHETRSYM